MDINGDGAADYLNAHESVTGVQVYFNDGLRFRNLVGLAPEAELDSLPAATRSNVDYFPPEGILDTDGPGNTFIVAASRTARTRLIDADADGRVDIAMEIDDDPLTLGIRYNAGGALAPLVGSDHGMNPGLSQRVMIAGILNNETSYRWETKRDVVDLDGDGLPEMIDFEALPQRYRHDHAGKPPRLLTTIRNGRGAVTNVLYAPMSDATVVKTPNKKSPRAGWVVKSIEATDDFESDGLTSYEYEDPVFNADDEGRFAFRGFKEVTATGPRGSQTIQRYGFGEGCPPVGECDPSPDWSGRLVATLTKLVTGAWTPSLRPDAGSRGSRVHVGSGHDLEEARSELAGER